MHLRLWHALLLIPLLSAPVLAETTTAEHHGRRSAADHFADANSTHDGHLTLDQAKSGYKTLVKPFAEIDLNHRGYITLDDIKAWRAAKKAAKQAAKSGPSDSNDGVVRPTPAMQRGGPPAATSISTDMVAPRGTTAPTTTAGPPKAPRD